MTQKKNYKTLLWIGLSIVALIVIVLVIQSNKKKKAAQNAENEQPEATGATGAITPTASTPAGVKFSSLPAGKLPLAKGQISKLGYMAQVQLNEVHGAGLVLDGNFGTASTRALNSAYGVSSIDSATAKKMVADLAAKQSNKPDLANLTKLFASTFGV